MWFAISKQFFAKLISIGLVVFWGHSDGVFICQIILFDKKNRINMPQMIHILNGQIIKPTFFLGKNQTYLITVNVAHCYY